MTLESLIDYIAHTDEYMLSKQQVSIVLGASLAYDRCQRILTAEKEKSLAALVEIDNKNVKLHEQIETIKRETEERVHREHLESHEFMSQAIERLEGENKQLRSELEVIANALVILEKYRKL